MRCRRYGVTGDDRGRREPERVGGGYWRELASFFPVRRILLTTLQRTIGSRNFVIFISLVLGLALFWWGRTELASMFERDETGEIVLGVVEADPACAPPSLYFIPAADEPGVYLGAVDFLGGGIADPSIMNIGRPAIALEYGGGRAESPLAARRASPAECSSMVLRLAGGFDRLRKLDERNGEQVNVAAGAGVTIIEEEGSALLTIDLADAADEADARTAFRLEGVRDIWQFGYRRMNFWNSGRAPLNVFLLTDRDFAFMSQTFDPIVPPLRARSVAALHLSPPGRDGGNAFQIFSRYLDYDARLQSWLITVSTVFGIGISLMVEGVILLLLRVARYYRSASESSVAGDDPRDVDNS